jgi:nucleoside-diphosphate-sugar epimerase
MTDWEEALEGVEAVVHLAARVHVVDDRAPDPLAAYRRLNVAATERLAEAASRRARRFVFVSSVKVNGEQTTAKPFDEMDLANPAEPYAVSKWEAENALRRIAARSGMEVVIIRPPLVYGPGVRANFLRLMQAVYGGLPLPLPHIENRRSLIGVENLAHVLVQCVNHPAAANRTFLVSDDEDISTRELVSRIARAFGRPCRLVTLPESWLRLTARVMGRQEEMARLFGSLTVSCVSVRERLGWSPPVALNDGLEATTRWYVSSLS